MKSLKKLITSGLLFAVLVGCGTVGNNNPSDTGKIKSGLLNEFSIIAYSGPPLEEVNLERYQEIAEAGIEFLVPANGSFNEEQNLKAMDLGAKTGIRIIPVDLRLFSYGQKVYSEKDTLAIKEVVDSYKNHASMAAYVIKDEPGEHMFPSLKTMCDICRAEDPEHEPLINLFPNYGTIQQFGVSDYQSYVRSYIETVEPGLLAYDSYALRNGVTLYDSWFTNLEVIREEAKSADIPFIVFVQSQGIKEGLRVPNREEILWQVNTALAYGTQGIGWFSYWTPAPDQGFQQEDGGVQAPNIESHYNAMIDINGNRTEVYNYVREANLYLKKAGKGLLGWENTDIARYESGKMLDGGSSPVLTPEGDKANIVIGTFKKDNSSRIVISNSSCEKPVEFSLKISEDWNLVETFTCINASSVEENDSNVKWIMEPGGSVLIDLKQN